jgi:hypothetical protein
VQSLFAAGIRVIVPEIVDYEVRRELLRANKQSGLVRLNTFGCVQNGLEWSRHAHVPSQSHEGVLTPRPNRV